jgi:hypothetical protein
MIDYGRNRLQDDLYPKLTAAETAFRLLDQGFSDRLHARTWYVQFREVVLRCAVKNIDDYAKASR